MRFNKQRVLLPAFLFIVAGAYGQEIHYNYDRGANFAAFRTYQWVDARSGPSNAVGPLTSPGSALPDAPPNLPAPPVNLSGGAPNFPGVPSDIRGPGTEDQLIDQEIKRAVDEQLAQKGLTKVDKNGDLQVSYQAAIRQEKSIDISGMGWGGSELGPWDGSVQGQTSTIPIGTIVVSLDDGAAQQLIWRGDATKTIDLKKDPDKNYKTLQKAMEKLFKCYPPPRK